MLVSKADAEEHEALLRQGVREMQARPNPPRHAARAAPRTTSPARPVRARAQSARLVLLIDALFAWLVSAVPVRAPRLACLLCFGAHRPTLRT